MFWTLFAPSTQNVNLLMPQQSSDKSLVIRDTFLNWYVSENTAATEAPETYRLLGIIAGENGSAVLKTTDGSSIAVRLGDEIAPGVKLVALAASQITIERAGVRQIIKLPEKSSAAQGANGEHASTPFLSPNYSEPQPPFRQQNAIDRRMRELHPVRTQDGAQGGGGGVITSPVSDNGSNIVGESSSSGSVQTIQQGINSQTSQASSNSQTTSTNRPTVVNSTTPRPTLPPITLSRGQLMGILMNGNVGGWDKGLSSVPGGGIRVDDATIQPLANTLQLKSGDILKSINNNPLTQVSDISLFFQAFGNSESVDLVLIRDGATLTQHYDIKP